MGGDGQLAQVVLAGRPHRGVAHLAAQLPEGPQYFPEGTVSDQPEERWVAELVREQLLAVTHDELPYSIATRVTDVSQYEEVLALADHVFATHDHVDVLCNNAGVFAGGLIWERPPSDFEWTLGVNLWGILHGVRAFVPRMIAAGRPSHIVNTVSMAGICSTPFTAPYNVSKFAASTAGKTSIFTPTAAARSTTASRSASNSAASRWQWVSIHIFEGRS